MKLLIIADDLTGANATSVLLAQDGFKSATYLDSNSVDSNSINNNDIIAISTNSRGISKNEAYDRVNNEVLKFNNPNIIFNKRIDSTLRGNIGAEIDAILDNKPNSIAIVVASYPDSGRISVGGFLLVNSVPLQNTFVSRDPKYPVNNSCIKEIISSQTKYPVANIHINDVLRGYKYLASKIQLLHEEGNRIIVVDAAINNDIKEIAKAAKETSLDIVTVDPGPFTKYYLSQYSDSLNLRQGKKVFFAIGSVTNTTINQIEYLIATKSPALIKVDAVKLLNETNRELEINRVVTVIMQKLEENKTDLIGISTVTREDEILNLDDIGSKTNLTKEDISIMINKGLATITRLALKNSNNSVGAIYTSGGDVTKEVMESLNVKGIRLKDEVIPLAVYGKFIEGDYPNMPAITKGGLIGDKDTLTKCLDYLLTKISTQYYLT